MANVEIDQISTAIFSLFLFHFRIIIFPSFLSMLARVLASSMAYLYFRLVETTPEPPESPPEFEPLWPPRNQPEFSRTLPEPPPPDRHKKYKNKI